jgi:hypothetical protein
MRDGELASVFVGHFTLPEQLSPYAAVFSLVAVLIVMLIPLAWVFVGEFRNTRKPYRKTVVKPEKLVESEPRIGYKRAFLRLELFGDEHFAGVVGHKYSVDAEAINGVGFHAYSTLAKALKHPQKGDVFLEVLLSGVVTDHEDGYVATHQRVLQLITERCDACERGASYFGLYSEDKSASTEVNFSCRRHRPLLGSMHALARIRRPFTGDNATKVRPIVELPKALPWLDKHGIVVAELTGPNKLVPTVIAREETTA